MKDIAKYLILGCSIIISICVLSAAITYYGRSRDVISVTGLGETTFTSDMIVWQGSYSYESTDLKSGYMTIEQQQKTVAQYLREQGVTDDEVTFSFIDNSKNYTSIYNESGNYVGSRFIGYRLNQTFVIQSNNVDKIERISREISSLIAKDIKIDSYTPDYYYTKLDDLKLELIEKASKDAHMRAQKIASNAGAKLGKASNARLGVFQITSATGNEEFSGGGAFNTDSKEKKARITVRIEYKLK